MHRTPSRIELFDIEKPDVSQGMAGAIYSEAQKSVAAAFTVARREAGFRQADLASAIGKHQSYISDIERGQRRIDVLELLVIARALGMAPVALYGRLTADVGAEFRL